MKKLLLTLCAVGAFAFNAQNFKSEIVQNINNIKEVLSSTDKDKSDKLYLILESHLDKELIPRLVLGKEYFAKAPAEFSELFFKQLKKDLAGKIDLLDANSLELTSASVDDKRCKASANVSYEDSKKQIDFLFRKVADECKLYDISMMDTSFIASYRSQFIDIIKQDGMNALINKLK